MKNLTIRPLNEADIEPVSQWLFQRLANQPRYAGRAFKPDVVGVYIRASLAAPMVIYCAGAFADGEVKGVLCAGMAEHPFFDCITAANITYQVEAGCGKELIDDFTAWAYEHGAHEIQLGFSAFPDKHDVYKRLMRKHGYNDSDLTFYKVV